MAKIKWKRSLTKLAAGMLGGYYSGGKTGAVIGGGIAAFTGGKNKPLKSFLIGAGTGYLGRTVSNKMGYTTPTPTAASKSVSWLGKLFAAPQGAPVAEGIATPPILPSFGFGGEGEAEQRGLYYPGMNAPGEFEQGQGGGIVPLLLLGGAILFLGVA
jgi:hypothetical protein